jgi:tetratricopeptide (TPR) repeat protein
VKGAIEPGVVPALLRSIYGGRLSGMLRFIREEERRSVRFMGGHIVYGEASVASLRLGAVLVAAQRVEAAVIERATEVMQRDRKRLGAVLVEMGILDQNGLEEALALHVRAILTSVFSLRSGTYTFQEQDPEAFLEDDWPLAVSTAEAVLAAARAVHGREDVRFALGSLDAVLLVSDDPLILYQRMDLGAEEAVVLARVDGTRSAREVMRLSSLGETTAERSLFALLCTGIVEPAPALAAALPVAAPGALREEILAFHARLPRSADHEVLGVAPDASVADVKAAYLRLARQFHPDVVHERGLADLRERIEAVFFRLHDAYRTMTVGAGRAAAPEPAPAARNFEDVLRDGRERLGEGRSWDAALLFEEVARDATGRMRTRARVLLARALLQLPDREKPAEKALQEAVADDPQHVEAHYLLGTLYRRRGLATRAASSFRRALEIEPGHRAALAELDALGADRGPSSPPRSSRRA